MALEPCIAAASYRTVCTHADIPEHGCYSMFAMFRFASAIERSAASFAN